MILVRRFSSLLDPSRRLRKSQPVCTNTLVTPEKSPWSSASLRAISTLLIAELRKWRRLNIWIALVQWWRRQICGWMNLYWEV